MLCEVFAFGLDPWVANVNDILTFESRRMSFWHEGSLFIGLRNKSYYALD